VRRLPDLQAVFNIEVEGEHEYFANGILTHNCAWANAEEVFDMLVMTMRLGNRPQIIATTTPRPVPIIRKLLARVGKDVLLVRGSTRENAANLPPSFLQQLEDRYAGTRLGRQEIEAELLEDIPGALWTLAMIDATRARTLPPGLPEHIRPGMIGFERAFAAALGLKRIVIAVDPSGAASENDEKADEIGIVSVGLDRQERAHLLEDATACYSPEGWGAKAVELYDRWGADRIVAERNFGGAMVEATIRAAATHPTGRRRNVPVTLLNASRGKVQRAEPVAALYEQGRVIHQGAFPKVEDQLCAFTRTGYQGDGSPDAGDALIWACSELLLGEGESYNRDLTAWVG
jgi:phage terminase large subunit-like protein